MLLKVLLLKWVPLKWDTTEMGATQEVTSEGVATEAGVGSSDDSLECQSLEVWCGGNSNQLEVWTLPWSDNAAWTT